MKIRHRTPKGGNCTGNPLRRVISLGYYDGTTSGVANCIKCKASFYYEMIWPQQSDSDLRVFEFFQFPERVFESVEKEYSAVVGAPKWPVWVPIAKGAQFKELKRKVDFILECPKYLIVAMEFPHQIRGIFEAKDFPKEKLVQMSRSDWVKHCSGA